MRESAWYRRPVVVAPVVLALAACGWALWGRDGTPSLSDAGARGIATAFLSDVRAGKVDDAWGTTSADFKSMYGRDRFRGYARSKPLLKAPAECESCEFRTEGELRIAECTFRPSSGKGVVKVVLHPHQGQWKVGRLVVE